MNIKYKQIIVIAIASIMIFSGFLILISQSSSPVEKNKKIIFNDISSSNVNYDFSFLNSTQYNKSDIIVANNSIWYYSLVNYTIFGYDLCNGNLYKYPNSNPIINNTIQIYIPLNYIYFYAYNGSLYYINLTNFNLEFSQHAENLGTNLELANFISSYSEFLPSFFVGGNGYTNIIYYYNNFTSKFAICKYSQTNPIESSYPENENNHIMFDTFYYSDFNISYSSSSNPNFNNTIQIHNNLYAVLSDTQSTYIINTSSYSNTYDLSKGYLYNLSAHYSTDHIIPSLLYCYYNPTNSTIVIHNTIYKKINNLLLLPYQDFSENFYLNKNYQIQSTNPSFRLNLTSITQSGQKIENYFIFNNTLYQNKQFINGSYALNFYLFPLNYSTFYYNGNELHLTNKNYTLLKNNVYYYNITLNYQNVSYTVVNNYNLYGYLFPISVVFFFLFMGMFLYIKWNWRE